MGDFWNKSEAGGPALAKWPASHPGVHGFDAWFATEASASSTTPNCGCDAAWPREGRGCVTGGGNWTRQPLDCTNYWGFSAGAADRPDCRSSAAPRDCVANFTAKIPGDDSAFLVGEFLTWADASKTPWLAQLSLHTVHTPHPALPEWFYAYSRRSRNSRRRPPPRNIRVPAAAPPRPASAMASAAMTPRYEDASGAPAGDYLGTVSQMDAAVGALVDGLARRGLRDDTLLWASIGDNGPHTVGGARPGGRAPARESTAGLEFHQDAPRCAKMRLEGNNTSSAQANSRRRTACASARRRSSRAASA